MKRSWSPVLVVLAACAFALASCQGIGRAPASIPRIEVEVVYEIDYGFVEPLAEADLEALDEILRSAVQPMADVGLRFYPVPSSDYLEGQSRPEYALTIRALRLEPERELERQEGQPESGDAAVMRAALRRVRCAVSAEFARRRDDAPSLGVGQAVGESTVSPKRTDASRAFRLDRAGEEVNDTEITAETLRRALTAAAERALAELQVPIDRELSLLAGRDRG